MTIQYIITGCIVLICIGIAVYRAYRMMTDAGSACKGCQLKETCTKHAGNRRRRPQECER